VVCATIIAPDESSHLLWINYPVLVLVLAFAPAQRRRRLGV